MLLNQNDVFAGRYVLQEMLGKGGFSVVWKATDNMADDTVVAIKIYAPDKGLDNQGIKQFSREYSLVQSLHHTRLLTARHFDVYEGSPYLVVPFCSNGSVGHLISEKGHLSEKEIAEILYQVCEGLAYLHTREIIHQDIKPDNVLINDQNEYLLTDFGISSRVKNTLTKSTGSAFSMTVAYAAPERFAASPAIVPQGDMFAVGVMIYEMATGDVPWMGQGGMAVQQNVTLPELPSAFTKPLTQWMQSLMLKDPAARPTAKVVAEAAQHYLSKGQWPASPMIAPPAAEAPKPAYRGRETQKMEDIPFFQEQMSGAAPAAAQAPAPTPAPAAKPSSGKQTMAFGQGGAPVAEKKTPVGLYAGIAVAVVAAGVGGWFFLGNKKEEPVKTETTVVTTPQKETATVVTPKKDSSATSTTEPAAAAAPAAASGAVPAPETVAVGGGSFKMGNSGGETDEQEEHDVNIKGFQISKTEVTYDQYAAYCKAVGKPNPTKGSGNVAVNVSWNDAAAYCKWLSKETGSNWSLPTEAQWEYAAKKGSLSGMTNGVLEWCSDWYDEQYYTYASPDNPTGPSSGGSKVVRGNSKTDREFFAPAFKQPDLSFRVIKK